MYARESFTIAEVADLLSIRRLSDSYQDEFPVECPFCGDLRGKCSFCIRKNGELKNVYHCYHCGAAGNMLTLYAELSGIYGRNRYKEAYREIKQELSFSGTDKRQQSTTRNGFVSIVSKKKRISLTEEEWDYRDHVYKEMLTFLKLKETHRRNLLLRGLTLNEVRQMEERGFLSTDDENSVTIARKLLKKGFRLDGVPGFFINRDGDWEAAYYRKNNGYLCPVRDGKERIIGFQIRLDVPLKERKYLWFTSSGLKLKETHRRNLLLRGLTLNEVRQMEERGFLSTDDENSVTIARKLLKKGFRLDGVPGFFINRDGDWEAAYYRKNNGYLCPVRDGKERIIGFQIRLDVPLKERKYLWFTSSGLERGTSSGSPAGMFGKIKDGTVYVTEGILKAEIAWMCTGNPYIGVPGVSNHKGLETVLRKLKEQGLKRVYECYDMDKMMELSCKHDEKSACRQCEHGIYLYHGECPKKRRKRDMIRKGCIKLYEICEELNVSCKRVTWDTDASGTWMEHYKGVDDWILRKEEKGHRKTA